jgi:hypothetical protein
MFDKFLEDGADSDKDLKEFFEKMGLNLGLKPINLGLFLI